ncbi:flagellar filament capping protein FliD [Geotoga petraea]|nr:flagellar filament capping protein FliD [Geotoga petraea]
MDNSYLGNFQMLGISSGMDTGAMIDALMKAERMPLNRAEEKYNNLALQQKTWMEIDDKLEELWTSTSKLRLQSSITPKTVKSSNESILTASATADAIDNSFYVKVNEKASSTNLSFDNSISFDYTKISQNTKFVDLDHNITPEIGSYSFNYTDSGVDKSFSIDINSNTTLSSIITKINTESGNDLKAELIDGKFTISDNTGNVTNISLGKTTDTSNFAEVFDMAFSTYDGTKIQSSSDIIDYSSMKLSNLIDISAESTINMNGTDITVNTDTTLSNFIAQVNNSDAEVFMSFDNNSKKLSVRNSETGPIGLNITDDTTTNLLNKLGMSGSETINQGQKAEIEIYGSASDSTPITTLTSWDNNFDYNSTSINIFDVSTDKVAVDVTQDTEKAVENIKEFVEKYNETMEFLYEKLHENKVTGKSLEDMTEEEKMQGMLKGDRNLETLFFKMRSTAYKTISWDTDNTSDEMPEYSSLQKIGITSGDTGSNYDNTIKGLLNVNESELTEALENNPEDVYKLFANNTSYEIGNNTKYNFGIVSEMKDYLWQTTKFGGFIDNVSGTSGTLGRQMRDLSKRMVNMMDQLQRKELMYYRKFSAMEQSISRMQAQGAYITQKMG